MKILLLGASGQLAHDLKQALSKHEVVGLTRTELDIENVGSVVTGIRDHTPDLVINTAAYNLVDQAETEPHAAFSANCLGPRNLALVCGDMKVPLLHFSTDYVFGLEPPPNGAWKETDAPGPVSMYGVSKLSGEYAVRTHCPKHYVVRTCGLYGVKGSRGKGGNFVETMLRLAGQGKPVRVVDDQQCTPSYTKDVAAAAAALIETGQYGLYHLTNSGRCSWYELACEIFRLEGLTVDCQPITSEQFGAPARRPPCSVLDTTKLQQAGVPAPPTWQDAVARYLADRKSNPA